MCIWKYLEHLHQYFCSKEILVGSGSWLLSVLSEQELVQVDGTCKERNTLFMLALCHFSNTHSPVLSWELYIWKAAHLFHYVPENKPEADDLKPAADVLETKNWGHMQCNKQLTTNWYVLPTDDLHMSRTCMLQYSWVRTKGGSETLNEIHRKSVMCVFGCYDHY